MVLISFGGWLLRRSLHYHDPRPMFIGYVLSSAGGMIYRFSPTTLAFRPNPEALYFPATIEVLVSLGFICSGHRGISDRGETVCHSARSAAGVARHGELFPVPAALYPVDRIFQVRTFRRRRNNAKPIGELRLTAGTYGKTNHD